MPITRGTKQAILFGGGGGEEVSYLLRATFDAADQGFANAQVLDTVDEGIQDGQLTVVETDGTLAIVSNKVVVTGQVAVTWNGLGLYSQVVSRLLGRGLLAKINSSVTTNLRAVGITFRTTAAATTVNREAFIGFNFPSDGALYYHHGPSGGLARIGIFSILTDYTIAIILGGYDSNSLPYYFGQLKTDYAFGAWLLIKGGAFTNWTLLWTIKLSNTASLYAALETLRAECSLDDLRVPDKDLSDVIQPTALSTFTAANGTSLDAITPEVGGAWTEQSGAWDIQSNRANPDGAAIATVVGIADAIVDCVINGGTADNPAIALRFSDTSNYWYLQADRVNNQLELHEYNATVDTVRANVAVTINDSTDYDLRAIAYGQTINGYINAGSRISYGSAVLNETETVHGIRAENTAGQFDDFAIFPRTAAIYDTTLDAV